MRVRRFEHNPIITPQMSATLGTNINGPSLIRVPEWVERPLGRYYLYFAHHQGKHIRLAYADALAGPWSIHEPGVLALEDSLFVGHIASPDVHVDFLDEGRHEIRMYYHGPLGRGQGQRTRVALSEDGLRFRVLPEVLGVSYFRCVRWGGHVYAVARPGNFYRSRDGLTGFGEGPTLFKDGFRHGAFALDGDTLQVYYSAVGDCPERIVRSTIELRPDWTAWRPSERQDILEPELPYEGAGLPLAPSRGGWAPEPVRELRDPAIYREDGRTYLLYSVAGEQGIAIAELEA